MMICACAALAACGPPPPDYFDPDAGPPIAPDAGTRPPHPPRFPPTSTVMLPAVDTVEQLPPIAGGTLIVTDSGLVVAGDPDRASIWVLAPEDQRVVGRVALDPTADPGRMVEDADGRVHVVLRQAGAVMTIDPQTASEVETRAVCGAPRGIAWDEAGEQLWVACAGGELLTLPPSRSPVSRVLMLDDDLRDVLVGNDRLFVSRFHSAELLEVEPLSGEILRRRVPPTRQVEGLMRIEPGLVDFEPNTAWQMRFDEAGDVVMLHQTSVASSLQVEMMGYSGGGCGGVVSPSVTVFSAQLDEVRAGGAIGDSVLAVDFVLDPARDLIWLASGATDALAMGFGTGPTPIREEFIEDPCVFREWIDEPQPGSATAMAWTDDGRLVTLRRDPMRVTVQGLVTFSAPAAAVDRGFDLFHTATPSLTACASCHPEGGEDGHTWIFAGTGARRTQALQGGLLETAPFHWSGDQPNMEAIMMGGFMMRMGGRSTPEEANLIAQWLDGVPMPARPRQDADAVERGRAHFESETAGCASCHGGDAYTSNETVDVGTGEPFQVPSLRGVALRAPYFHDGCAPTLEAALFGECATAHGSVDHLDEAQRADLTAFIRSL